MPKGKIAVIEVCSKCPYLAFDSKIGIIVNKDNESIESNESEIAYCGWFKPLDNTKIRLEEYIDVCSPKFGQPDNCPLPDGCDNSKWRNIWGEDESKKFPNSTIF